ncbi:hypothetical protein GALMADRAFT_223712 [Galerina marginata CBS 339.88]|uniref:Uncharacterized protein n=1 Tax=Galerina marginata (strain CBS 339.88) TaxID=685588 RepID=A0A067TKQ4_GALM3|nr:hypothetical protein GALMADRAFT_223712 [Galerina marginata CBS 339.88]
MRSATATTIAIIVACVGPDRDGGCEVVHIHVRGSRSWNKSVGFEDDDNDNDGGDGINVSIGDNWDGQRFGEEDTRGDRTTSTPPIMTAATMNRTTTTLPSPAIACSPSSRSCICLWYPRNWAFQR